MFNLYRKVKEFDFPLDLSLHLLKTLVSPVLMHGSQVWGTLDHSDIEKIQLKYCKYILNINNPTPSVMIYGELSIYPLEIEIICGIVGLWFSIIKLSYVMYQMLYRLHNYEIYTSSWIMYLKNIFDKCGMSNIWMVRACQPSVVNG